MRLMTRLATGAPMLRSRTMLKLLAVCTIAGVGIAAFASAASPQGQTPPPQYSADLKVGDPAPQFSLPGSDGKTHRLADYKGKTVALAWFVKAFTGG
jgi:cytochrome oxidase Cu insertion factor (SCO1/SenC/PrrC family)